MCKMAYHAVTDILSAFCAFMYSTRINETVCTLSPIVY